MQDMLYTRTGQVEWINQEELIQEVSASYLDFMADFPSIRSLCPQEVAERLSNLEDKAQNDLLELKEATISGSRYLLAASEQIKNNLERDRHHIFRHWLLELLKEIAY